MNSAPGGRSARHRHVMELLAQARPERLDPEPGLGRRAAGLAAVLQSAPDTGPQLSPPARPLRRAALGAGLTLTACATGVAVLIATAGNGDPASHGPVAPAAAAGLSARQILLTAAVSAASQPAAGRYWRVDIISGSITAAGPNAHPYAVEQRWAPSLTWDARSPDQRTWTFPADGYRSAPATPGAAAAWRAFGSPKLPSQRDRQQGWWQTGGDVGYLGNGNLTFAQFQRLPSSPAALAAVVRRAAELQVAPQAKPGARSWSVSAAGQLSLSADMFGVYVQLLKLDPITPAVRAAVFRDLALLSGVRSIGQVTDPLGRTGYGIAQRQAGTAQKGQQADEEVLVIAPRSGVLLADEFVVTSPAAGAAAAASGAVPGLAACPKGTALRGLKRTLCVIGGRVVRSHGQTRIVANPGEHAGLTELGPQLALRRGQVDSYDAVVSASWTSAPPKLPPQAQQFSVARDSKG